MKLFIVTCDKTSYILKAFEYLLCKYAPIFNYVVVLGGNVFPELSDNFKIVNVSMDTEISGWCHNLNKYFKSIDDEFVILGLDDFLLNRGFDSNVFNVAFDIMKSDPLITRYELGVSHGWHHGSEKITHRFGDFDIFEYGKLSEYKISTQFSVWRKDYLLEYLKEGWSPWDFEIKGSALASKDDKKVIATIGRTAMDWTCSVSTVKHPGMVDVNRISKNDIEYMILNGILNRNNLQIGRRNAIKYE